jgi:SAM-dependent methyltransferase
MPMNASERSTREKVIANETDVYEHWHSLRRKYRHIFDCPNSIHAEQTIDISERLIALAKQNELPNVRDYTIADLSEPFEGVFDVIVDRSILHHLNYLSLPLGILSSFLFKNPNNMLLHFAALVDSLLARYVPWQHDHFRSAIFIIHKP